MDEEEPAKGGAVTPDEFAAAAHVSRETMTRLEAMDHLLIESLKRHNLIARSTIADRWRRHYLDAAQIASLFPANASRIFDLGSGAGFPGLVLAAMLAEKDVSVTLVESTGKKAQFLSAAAAAMGLSNVTVLPERIEKLSASSGPDIITARALARLAKLLGYGAGIAKQNTRYFLHKGQDVEGELTEAAKYWHMEVIRHKSITSPDATILEIGNLRRVQ